VHSAETALFTRVAILAEDAPRVLPPRDGVLLKARSRRAIGVEHSTFRRRFVFVWVG
jgi:hypothetical protein